MNSPRPYQATGIDLVREKFRKGDRRTVLCLPTGGGKTFMFSMMAQMTVQNGGRVLIIVDRKELLKQAANSLRRFGIEPQIIAPGFDPQPAAAVVAMVETLANRDYPWLQPTLVIIDEAHMGNFKKVFARFPGARFVGVTATPIYSGKNHHMRDDYNSIVVPVQISELIDQGYLVKPKYFVSAAQTAEALKMGAHDYTAASLSTAFDNQQSIAATMRAYDKCVSTTPGRTLVYGVSVHHAKYITYAFEARGVKAAAIHSKLAPHERDYILDWLNQDPAAVVVNVDVLTKGFDCPPLQNIVLARATASFPLYLQILGRGGRTHPGKGGFTVADLGGNIARHGKWEDDIDWHKEFHYPEYRQSEGIAPVKECPECGLHIHPTKMVCPECGHRFAAKAKASVDSNIVELTAPIIPRALRKPHAEMSVEELCEYVLLARRKDGKPYSRFWVGQQLAKRNAPVGDFIAAAKYMKINQKAFLNYFGK